MIVEMNFGALSLCSITFKKHLSIPYTLDFWYFTLATLHPGLDLCDLSLDYECRQQLRLGNSSMFFDIPTEQLIKVVEKLGVERLFELEDQESLAETITKYVRDHCICLKN